MVLLGSNTHHRSSVLADLIVLEHYLILIGYPI